MNLTPESVSAYAKHWKSSEHVDWLNRVKAISMLHQETLALLRLFAAQSGGSVLEIGPYVGGSTIAIAEGLKDAGGGKLVSVEAGGPYLDHPTLPSRDICADLKTNLRLANVSAHVTIIEGWSDAGSTRRRVSQELSPNAVGLYVVDANAFAGNNFWLYESFLKDDCLIIHDDYISSGAAIKQSYVSRFIDSAVKRGMFKPLAVVQWGTWVGRYCRQGVEQRRLSIVEDRVGWTPLFGRQRFPLITLRRWKYFRRQARLLNQINGSSQGRTNNSTLIVCETAEGVQAPAADSNP